MTILSIKKSDSQLLISADKLQYSFAEDDLDCKDKTKLTDFINLSVKEILASQKLWIEIEQPDVQNEPTAGNFIKEALKMLAEKLSPHSPIFDVLGFKGVSTDNEILLCSNLTNVKFALTRKNFVIDINLYADPNSALSLINNNQLTTESITFSPTKVDDTNNHSMAEIVKHPVLFQAHVDNYSSFDSLVPILKKFRLLKYDNPKLIIKVHTTEKTQEIIKIIQEECIMSSGLRLVVKKGVADIRYTARYVQEAFEENKKLPKFLDSHGLVEGFIKFINIYPKRIKGAVAYIKESGQEDEFVNQLAQADEKTQEFLRKFFHDEFKSKAFEEKLSSSLLKIQSQLDETLKTISDGKKLPTYGLGRSLFYTVVSRLDIAIPSLNEKTKKYSIGELESYVYVLTYEILHINDLIEFISTESIKFIQEKLYQYIMNLDFDDVTKHSYNTCAAVEELCQVCKREIEKICSSDIITKILKELAKPKKDIQKSYDGYNNNDDNQINSFASLPKHAQLEQQQEMEIVNELKKKTAKSEIQDDQNNIDDMDVKIDEPKALDNNYDLVKSNVIGHTVDQLDS